MSTRKQSLLALHRRHKRVVLLFGVLVLAVTAMAVAWWLAVLLLLCGWIAHEAWFADHLFYSPRQDYQYCFPNGTTQQQVSVGEGRVALSSPLASGETLFLELRVTSSWIGRWLDPHVMIGGDRQDFERGARGRRFLNLSGQETALAAGELRISGRHCRLSASGTLYVLHNPDYAGQHLMILAPHADDAELAAFGLYRRAAEVSIVTLTQGETEAVSYRRLGLDAASAARLKGRLRAWDSMAVPLWGGVPQTRCVQLGYHCMQLSQMLADPRSPFPSRESGEVDVRTVRQHNPLRLPADTDGLPCGANLVADLAVLLDHFRPQVVVTPHPQLDPHVDHVAATRALELAMQQSTWQPEVALLYANHLHDNDRWPMGPAGNGIALPPALLPLPVDGLWSPLLSPAAQLDKAMALAMQHDLQGSLRCKQRLRRLIQRALAARRWPATGDDEFFRKAVRRHELFWVRHLRS